MENFFPILKKTKSEPPKSSRDVAGAAVKAYQGDPENNKYGKKYLEMSLEEKRKLYRCGDKFEVPDNLPLWPVIWKFQSHRDRKTIGAGKKKVKKTYKVNHELNNKICLHQGDITRLEVDAIVNAANTSLLGGGGVDGCIHRMAGSSLREECATLNGCKTGNAKITSGHKLPAKYVIHTVGPVGRQPTYLQSCYENCLHLVLKHNIRTIAFCCISTGIYGYPNEDAGHIALQTIRDWMEKDDNAQKVDKIIFCVYLDIDSSVYEELLQYYFPCEESDPEKTTGHEKGDLKESSSKEVPKASFEESDSKEVTSDAFQEPDSKEGIKKSSQELRPKETDECVENPESELNKGNEGDEILMDDDSELTKRVEELDEIPDFPTVPDHDPNVD